MKYWLALLGCFTLLGDDPAGLADAPLAAPADPIVALAAEVAALDATWLMRGIWSPTVKTGDEEMPPVPPAPKLDAEGEARLKASDVISGAPEKGGGSVEVGAKPEAPVLRIRAPAEVLVGHLAVVRFELSGGPVRELSVEIDPPLEVVDPDDEKQETAGLVQFEPTQIFITAPAGVRTISVLAIGKDVGFSKQEARVMFRDPRPAVPASVSENVPGRQEPRVVLKKFVDAVSSANKAAELKEVAGAARDVAARRRAGEFDDAAILEKWEEAAYLRLGTAAFKAWGPSKVDPGEKRRFFGYVADLLSDNAKLAGANAANLLDSLADILDGK